MESSEWVIAISTAVIAVVLLILALFFIKVGLRFQRNAKAFSDKIFALDKRWCELLNCSRSESVEQTDKPPRMLPKVLRVVLFGTALWKSFQKRR